MDSQSEVPSSEADLSTSSFTPLAELWIVYRSRISSGDDRVLGPYRHEILQEKIASGEVKYSDLVTIFGDTKWQRLGDSERFGASPASVRIESKMKTESVIEVPRAELEANLMRAPKPGPILADCKNSRRSAAHLVSAPPPEAAGEDLVESPSWLFLGTDHQFG